MQARLLTLLYSEASSHFMGQLFQNIDMNPTPNWQIKTILYVLQVSLYVAKLQRKVF